MCLGLHYYVYFTLVYFKRTKNLLTFWKNKFFLYILFYINIKKSITRIKLIQILYASLYYFNKY